MYEILRESINTDIVKFFARNKNVPKFAKGYKGNVNFALRICPTKH